jgi:hypothetical protein
MNKLLVIMNVILIIILIIRLNYKNKFSNENNLEYIHIPKTAGTSIENLGKKYNINWGRFNNEYKVKYTNICSKWHNSTFIYNKNNFTIIRNPYDRIISEFFYSNGNNHISKITEFNVWFNNILNNYNKNKYINDCHIIPQSEYVFTKDKNENKIKRIEHIIYMDNDMDKNLDKLFKKYNLGIDITDLPKSNKSKKIFSKNDLSQEMLDKIYNFYKDDFINFGFTKIDKTTEKFSNNKRLTLVFGYWEIKENSKHNIKHYEDNIKKTFSLLKNYDIVFFYNNDKYINIIKNILDKSNNIKFIHRNIEDLPAYKYSNKLLNLCKNQNNVVLNKINNGNEKGLVHFDRELKNGDNNYKKIMSIWFSKLYLIKECIEKNYYSNENIAWCDISITKFSNKILKNTLFYELDITNNKIIIFNNIMKYKGNQLKIGAEYVQSNRNKFIEFINKYIFEFENLNENYCHDEETIMNLVYNKNKENFIVLKAWN